MALRIGKFEYAVKVKILLRPVTIDANFSDNYYH